MSTEAKTISVPWGKSSRVNRRWIALVVGVLVVLAAAIIVSQRMGNARAATTSLQTAPTQRTTLVATVNAAGNIQAHEQLNLNFQVAGQVSKINVSVGDKVKAGQVLAELDSTDLALQVRQSELALKIAQAKLATTKRGADPNDVVAAKARLDAAKKGGPSAADIAAARARLESVKKNLADVQSGVDPVTKARQSLDKAKNDLWAAQIDRDGIAGKSSGYQLDSANLRVANAELAVQQAQQAYDAAVANQTNTPLAQAEVQVRDAEASLAKLLNTTYPQDVASAEASYKKLVDGPTAEDLLIAEANVETAQINLEQAQLKLKNAHLVAPFDGTVTAINLQRGQQVGSNTSAIALASTEHLEISINMAEVDLPKLQLSQEAQISLDAAPGKTLNGKVTQIAPAGVLQQGVVNYPIIVTLTDVDPLVKPGMTANVIVIVERKENVLVVPNRAIRTQGRQRLVTVAHEGQQIQVPVQTGMINNTQTEIISGLKEGDEVILNTTTASNSTRGFGGMAGGRPVFVGGPPPGSAPGR